MYLSRCAADVGLCITPMVMPASCPANFELGGRHTNGFEVCLGRKTPHPDSPPTSPANSSWSSPILGRCTTERSVKETDNYVAAQPRLQHVANPLHVRVCMLAPLLSSQLLWRLRGGVASLWHVAVMGCVAGMEWNGMLWCDRKRGGGGG